MFEKRLNELTKLLATEIPLWFDGHEVEEPVCCLRIYYFDTHAPFGHLIIRAIYAAERDALYDEADDFFDAFWNPAHWFGSGPEIYIGQEEPSDWRSEQLLSELYAELGSDSHMERYQMAIAKVCRALNQFDWAKMFSVTDDFSVVMADGSCFRDDFDQDLVDSLPPKKYDELVEIGWVGSAEYAHDSDFAEYSVIESQPVSQRIDSCIEVLRQEAADQSTEVGDSEACDLMLGCGKPGVEAMVEFALAYSEKLDWDAEGEEMPHQRVILNLFWKVRESGIASPKMERLLKEYVATSHRVNLNEEFASTLTRHAANCLHTLFPAYPATEVCEDTNRLLNIADFI